MISLAVDVLSAVLLASTSTKKFNEVYIALAPTLSAKVNDAKVDLLLSISYAVPGYFVTISVMPLDVFKFEKEAIILNLIVDELDIYGRSTIVTIYPLEEQLA